ncbi:unnamed protein product [Dovyalis caffra]|uniref:Enoyl reductase (ER) domain-containing protein n=1 Tax=Dovyalis caffra TaxID=77055 RepID=A0AAV1SXD9_9ROSI|nr:unnamed protein product [Dovyalis caffra]
MDELGADAKAVLQPSMSSESVKEDCLAWAARDPSGVLSPYQFSRRALGNDDVSLKITHCGVCYADVAWSKNKLGDSRYPLVPGHEIVGIVKDVGPNVRHFKVGDHVGVGTYVNSCRECEYCNDREEVSCEKGSVFTFNGIDVDGSITKGGYSSYIVVHERYCFQIPHNYPLASAAPLLCAGITVYNPMKQHKMNQPGKSLGVIGLGGLGHMAVKFGKAFGLKVTVLSTSISKKEEALTVLGADNFVITSDQEQMKALSKSLDFIIDTASGDHPFDPYMSLLKTAGVFVLVGFPSEVKFSPANLLIVVQIRTRQWVLVYYMLRGSGKDDVSLHIVESAVLMKTKKERALSVLLGDIFVVKSDQEQKKVLSKSLDFIMYTASGDNLFDPCISLLKTAGVLVLVAPKAPLEQMGLNKHLLPIVIVLHQLADVYRPFYAASSFPSCCHDLLNISWFHDFYCAEGSMSSESVKEDCLAWAARDPSGVLSPYQFSRRALGNDDVSLKITHCGVCYADVIWSKNKHGDSRYPLVPGHEIVGIVKDVGPNVRHFKVGDHVGVGTYVNSCRECEYCNDREEVSCEKGSVFTFNAIDADGSITKGGYSSYIVVHERYCFRIPHDYPLASAAPLLCAGITVYNPMKQHKMNQPGKSLGVIGLGGLGHMAVKFGKAFGLKVTVLSTSISKKEEALTVLGADNFVITSDQEQMKAYSKSLDFIIDTASGDHPFDPYMSLLKTAGVFVLVGFPSEVKFSPASLLLGEWMRPEGINYH